MVNTVINPDISIASPNPLNMVRKPGMDERYKKVLNHDGMPSSFFDDAKKVKKKIILLIDEDPQSVQQMNECLLYADRNYEIVNAINMSLAGKLIDSVQPDVIMMNWSAADINGPRLVRTMKANPLSRDIPVIVFTRGKASVAEIDAMLSAGAIDCQEKPADKAALTLRVKALIRQADSLNEIKRREERIRQKTEKLTENLKRLQAEVEFKERESSNRLELLIHSKGVNDKLLDKLHDLRPHLNTEGKTKLRYISMQLKWELDDEEKFNLEKKFDESNYYFYSCLEKACPELTKNEKRLCAYFKGDHTPSEIARITHKSLNCINVAFARIRAKLKLQNKKDLKEFLSNLDSTCITYTISKSRITEEFEVV